jgi:hypothetical protein
LPSGVFQGVESDEVIVVDGVVERASAQRTLHDRQNRRLTILVVALLALLALDVLLLAVGSRAPAWSSPLPRSRMLASSLGLGFAAGGAVAAVLALILTTRDTASRAFTRGMRPKDRKVLLKQVGGEQPTHPTDLAFVRGYAHALAGQSYTLLLPLAIALMYLGMALGRAARGDRWLTALAVSTLAGFVVIVLRSARQIRAARRFLDRHPEPQPPT